MGLEPDARLAVSSGVDLRKLPLTPVEFFVYSRVESLGGATPPTVSEVVAASGQPDSVAEAAITKLIELGALKLQAGADGRVPATPRPTPRPSGSAPGSSGGAGGGSGQELRDRARNRRRELLEAQMRAARGSAPAKSGEAPRAETKPDDDVLPVPRDDQRSAPSSEAQRSILDEVEPVAATDPRLEQGAAVDLDRQRRLLALRDRLRHIGHFELLGLEPTDDVKQIRRAYHVVSREFHPDSFYGKSLGSFGEVLDALFRRARTSYEFLLDADRRRPLVEGHQAQLRAEQERRDRERSAYDESVSRAAEAEREQAQKALDERAARDRERQLRIRDRALDKRRKQAQQQAEQAEREQEAGRHGTAATLFRLAHEQDPSNERYEQQWRESLAIARRQRAETSFAQGKEARRAGRAQEGARLLAEAAEADPSLRNLSEAAGAMAEVDPPRARELAMQALELLQQSKARGAALDERTMSGVHQHCAKAFLAAGQLASAKEQAERAHALAPSQQTRTLLNSIKLT